MLKPKSPYLVSIFFLLSLSTLSGCHLLENIAHKKTAEKQESALTLAPNQPTLVQVHANWCPACQNIKPTWEKLQSEYKGRVNFVMLDISSSKKLHRSMVTAQQLGLKEWFIENQSKTSTIVILLPPAPKGQILYTFINQPDENSYRDALKPLLDH